MRLQGYCDVYKWTILKGTSPEVKCLHPTSSRREMCTWSVSNVIYHKFSHGAAFYTLNGKTPPPFPHPPPPTPKCENLKRSESFNQWGETSCGEHAEWRILHHTDRRYSCCFGLKLNLYAFTCTAFSPYNLFSTRHCGYF